jgi:hypothetical protein
MKTKNEYIDIMASELKEWGAQGDLLAAKTEKSVGMIKLKYTEQLNAFRTKHQEANDKMKEYQEASGEAWEATKETADKVWDDLRTGLTLQLRVFSITNNANQLIPW